jgi:hypothetical protein
MTEKNITYPQYRKYNNNKSFFKIISTKKFEEIQLLGNKKSFHLFEAKILPDRNYIFDLTFNYSEHWIICAKCEYEQLKKNI